MAQMTTENAKISKRNYYMMIIEGSLFWIGASFIDGNAVVSVFINEATWVKSFWRLPHGRVSV